ncbi:MAG: electron transfer flavoprotein subunit beta/FixA family protein [Thermoplasmataceae archaeon]
MPYNIVVLIKQIQDIDQLKTDPQTGEPSLQNIPLRLENLSKNAIEAAVRLKEKYGGKVTGIVYGTEKASSAMKEAYAMGVDEGFVITGYSGNFPEVTAQVLSSKIMEIPHDIVILGNQSADSYTGLIGGMLSRSLKMPVIGNAVDIKVEESKVSAKVSLETIDRVVQADIPCIITVAQEINEPRLPAVLQIMAAGRKPINVTKSDLKPSNPPRVISNRAPKSDRRRIVFEDQEKGVAEVAKVIREVVR